ncbi:hypothetical protein ASPZODRAFT_64073 [Penicilliopsis zonata CBS 506.65]|uniref:Amidohydrolase-related domain-containing protein n=1 Tax=Penicilliopsis zonata CBS 506.65 TaxID=1073090 RepID=A0A1L9SKE6_9EURO|nr:hypothetical protein ASPZODRAFT_64073 [Penicilliopsis zonata CBS 506.65]OJJ47709.1 hypothetical protein ASPZODRAFT_64073 [Penicilliopsis zonata CBS 506.65]
MSQDTLNEDSVFPWDLGVHDAHCHPTDTMTSIPAIPHMKATTLTIMATRSEDQDLVYQTALSLQKGSKRVVPCFGWHPWFSHQLLDDINNESASSHNTEQQKTTHYQHVLTPPPLDPAFIASLPDPKPLSQFISETRLRVLRFPTSLVGEIGLDKAFRLPIPWSQDDIEVRKDTLTPGSREGRHLSQYRVQMSHQKAVLKAQLRLAGELGRPVSVHSVQAHGAVLDLLKELWRGYERYVPTRRERKERDQKEEEAEEEEEKQLPFPPRICMHSYSGPVEPIRQFLNPANPSDIYFSFSQAINFTTPSSKRVVDVIRAIPEDRLLIESDLHTAGEEMDILLEDITRTVCQLRGWELHDGVKRLARNWKCFIEK